MDKIKPDLVDELLKGYEKPEDVIGENGLLKRLTKALLERALSTELTIMWATKSTIRPATTVGTRATALPVRRSKASLGRSWWTRRETATAASSRRFWVSTRRAATASTTRSCRCTRAG